VLVFMVNLMNEMIRTEDVYYEYIPQGEDEAGVQAVKGVSMSVEQGSFVVVLGRNGSGKSTLARLMNGLLIPGKGTVIVDGIRTDNREMIWEIRKTLGLVFQNPDNQIVATTVEEDVAFGPENLGMPPEEIRVMIDRSLKMVNMEGYGDYAPHMLSGGQKQRIAIAGILAMNPKCIVLDEATSMLDPTGRAEVMNVLHSLNRDKGITIVLITHHMDEAVEADKIFVMESGRIILSGTPRQIFENVEVVRQAGLDVPQVTALIYRLNQIGIRTDHLPVTMEETIRLMKNLLTGSDFAAKGRSKAPIYRLKSDGTVLKSKDETGTPIIKVRNLYHTYMPGSTFERKALKDINLTINEGDRFGIIGQTGSGKSTLVQHLNGILKPDSGTLEVDGLKAEGKELKALRRKVGLIFQYPEHQLFEETVYKDIIFGLNKLNLSEDEIKERVFHTIDLLGISPELLEKSPFELSGGQKRRVAIAGVLVMKPKVLILDEPTAGLDPQGSSEVFRILSNLNEKEGTTIIIISHNMEEIAAFCNRVAVMSDGGIAMCDTTENIFKLEEELKKYKLDVPQITRLFRQLEIPGLDIPTILTIDEAVDFIADVCHIRAGGVVQ